MMELMVSIVIVSTLFVLAYPSFINQVSKARQSEAQSYLGAINRAQQSYYLQHRRFGTLPNLEVGIRSVTENYTYTTEPQGTGMNAIAHSTATPADITIRGYAGKVWVGLTGNAGITFVLLCEGTVGAVPEVEGNHCPN
jgi:type IV pilus assembly protein PilA